MLWCCLSSSSAPGSAKTARLEKHLSLVALAIVLIDDQGSNVGEMPAWFPLVDCNLATKCVPTDYFTWGGKTLCLSHLMCQEKGGKWCLCVHEHALKTW